MQSPRYRALPGGHGYGFHIGGGGFGAADQHKPCTGICIEGGGEGFGFGRGFAGGQSGSPWQSHP